MAKKQFKESSAHLSLFGALLRARKRYGGNKEAILDADERVLTYTEIVRASLALGSALKSQTKPKERVGILLPTGAGTLLAFFALHAIGRVPAMLNFTAGMHNINAALNAAEVTKVITAHKFIEVAGLETLEGELAQSAELIYLEEVRDGLTTKNKIVAALGSIFPAFFVARPSYKDPGVILFTSGTEGDPKGVVLSHKNLISNVEQVRAHVELFDTDIVFNPLPTFHCFGLTGGALLPLFLGLKVALYPSPLHIKIIPERIKKVGATIMFATDTFLSRYGRSGKEGDLDGLRFAVCGAEQVRDETRAFVKKKFGLTILEGYGATEAAPVVAVNQPEANRAGTVGHFLPGMKHRIDKVPGIEKGGRLFIQGPNVMMGYLTTDQPGVIQPLKDGWHDTGDVVVIDEDGFVAIRGRVKRFANIGGETISLAVVENCTKAVWPDNEHVALILPDAKKGEQIYVLSDCPDANRIEILNWAQLHGVPELSVPKKVLIVEEIPLLGTGKVDFVGAQKLLESLMGETKAS
jgi:acyl-[acyl-carrier-protein]-phospholipid O-acyltransferase/long-chain-fatty-acid--[acyl-carrier-protein] ligase